MPPGHGGGGGAPNGGGGGGGAPGMPGGGGGGGGMPPGGGGGGGMLEWTRDAVAANAAAEAKPALASSGRLPVFTACSSFIRSARSHSICEGEYMVRHGWQWNQSKLS